MSLLAVTLRLARNGSALPAVTLRLFATRGFASSRAKCRRPSADLFSPSLRSTRAAHDGSALPAVTLGLDTLTARLPSVSGQTRRAKGRPPGLCPSLQSIRACVSILALRAAPSKLNRADPHPKLPANRACILFVELNHSQSPALPSPVRPKGQPNSAQPLLTKVKPSAY